MHNNKTIQTITKDTDLPQKQFNLYVAKKNPLLGFPKINNREQAMETKRYLRTKEAATYLGISSSVLNKDRVTKMIGIPFTRVGRTILYDRKELDQWLKEQSGQA